MLQITKPILTSRTVWSNIIGLAALILSLTGLPLGSEEQSALVDAILAVIAGLGFIFSTIFRIIAQARLG